MPSSTPVTTKSAALYSRQTFKMWLAMLQQVLLLVLMQLNDHDKNQYIVHAFSMRPLYSSLQRHSSSVLSLVAAKTRTSTIITTVRNTNVPLLSYRYSRHSCHTQPSRCSMILLTHIAKVGSNDDDDSDSDDPNVFTSNNDDTTTDTSSTSRSSSSSSSSRAIPTTTSPQFVALIRQISKLLQRTSWISWWSQVILTVISSIILLFAKSISIPNSNRSFVISAIGIFMSTISILWTWGNGTRLSKRLLRTIITTTTTSTTKNNQKPITGIIPPLLSVSSNMKIATISTMIQRAITIGVVINCIGLLCNLFAAQQIVGLFAIKVFTSSAGSNRAALFQGAATTTSAFFNDNTLQPLDILIIQANTNVLLSQYISLIALLSLIPTILHKLQKYKHQDDYNDDDERIMMTKTTTSTTRTIINDE